MKPHIPAAAHHLWTKDPYYCCHCDTKTHWWTVEAEAALCPSSQKGRFCLAVPPPQAYSEGPVWLFPLSLLPTSPSLGLGLNCVPSSELRAVAIFLFYFLNHQSPLHPFKMKNWKPFAKDSVTHLTWGLVEQEWSRQVHNMEHHNDGLQDQGLQCTIQWTLNFCGLRRHPFALWRGLYLPVIIICVVLLTECHGLDYTV